MKSDQVAPGFTQHKDRDCMNNLGPAPCSTSWPSSQRGSFSSPPARMSLISIYAGCHCFGSTPRCGVPGADRAPCSVWVQGTRPTLRGRARYLGEAVALLRCALRFARGVAQGEHDGPLIEGCHVLQQRLRESACHSRHTCNSNSTVRRCFPTAPPQGIGLLPLGLVSELWEGTSSISGDAGGNVTFSYDSEIKSLSQNKALCSSRQSGQQCFGQPDCSTQTPKDLPEVPVVLPAWQGQVCCLRAPDPAAPSTSLYSSVWKNSYSSKSKEACAP